MAINALISEAAKYSEFPCPIINGQPKRAHIISSLFSIEITAMAYAPVKSFVASCVDLSKSFFL